MMEPGLRRGTRPSEVVMVFPDVRDPDVAEDPDEIDRIVLGEELRDVGAGCGRLSRACPPADRRGPLETSEMGESL